MARTGENPFSSTFFLLNTGIVRCYSLRFRKCSEMNLNDKLVMQHCTVLKSHIHMFIFIS